MCFAVPGKVIEIDGENAKIDYGKEINREGNISLISCKIGDYVIIQAGFVVEIVDKNRALRLLEMLENN